MFDGSVGGGGSKIDLGGRGHGRNRLRGAGSDESRSEFVKRQHREREARELKRKQEAAATRIQAWFRAHRCLRVLKASQRQIFDKRNADIVKAGSLLPADKKAKFVFLALLPMMRPFAFFFTVGEDQSRLSALLDLVMFSGQQALGNNIFHLAFDADDSNRCRFLFLCRRLLQALLKTGLFAQSAQVLVTLGAAGDRVDMALASLLRTTDAVGALTRTVLPQACESSDSLSAVKIVSLLVVGARASVPVERQRLLAFLLSTPRLTNFLCGCSSVAAHDCLQSLTSILDGAPAAAAHVGGFPHDENISGQTRQYWMMENLLDLLERFFLSGQGSTSILPSCVSWICWAKDLLAIRSAQPPPELERIHRSSFVRELMHLMDKQSIDGLLAVCRLYFGSDLEPPTEVLQTLAFATPLANRLFHVLRALMRHSSPGSVFEVLGAPSFSTLDAMQLRVFCAVYTLQLQPMYDYEFFGPANPLALEEVKLLALFLNSLAFHFIVNFPDRKSLSASAKALRSSITGLLGALYNRHCRRKIMDGQNPWIIQDSRVLLKKATGVVALGAREPELADDPMDVEPEARGENTRNQAVLEAILEEIPHVLPFEDRVVLLHRVISDDQAKRRDPYGPFGMSRMPRHPIRRNLLVEDGFAAFDSLTNDGALRDVFRVEFIAPDGSPESGIDGGGLFKEFMITICRAMFDPSFGLFSNTDENTLYPSVGAFRTHSRPLELYTFVGKVVGKGIYEMVLLEPQFCRVFLNRLLARINEVDDVAALDRELHRNMLRIKEATNIEELSLTFSVTISDGDYCEEVDLIPGGRNVPVTAGNLTRYFHLMANFKTNIQFQRQTEAFLQGLTAVVPLAWLKMFDPYELNILISGSHLGFDVQDLRRNTVLEGYRDNSPTIEWLWTILQHHMEPDDMGKFLMFATSCSRAPLLGFKTLFPKFCVHRVPDGQRLPTASTCANLLKLPDYPTFEVLKFKLLQAIRADAGFELA